MTTKTNEEIQELLKNIDESNLNELFTKIKSLDKNNELKMNDLIINKKELNAILQELSINDKALKFYDYNSKDDIEYNQFFIVNHHQHGWVYYVGLYEYSVRTKTWKPNKVYKDIIKALKMRLSTI